MNRWRNRFVWALMILAVSLLPGSDVECDCEDGEFEFDWPEIEYDDGGCYDCWGGDYYYYETWGYW